MEIIIILGVGLGLLWLLEIWNYRKFIAAAEALNTLANNMQEAFKGVAQDIVLVNNSLTNVDSRMDVYDDITTDLNSNDALIAVYLDLFRDALDIDPDKLSRVGKLKFPKA